MPRINKLTAFIVIATLALLIAFSRGDRFVARAAENKDTELSKHMEGIQDGIKKLRKSVKDAAANKESLETLTKLQQETVASKALVPAKAASVPEADRAKFVAGYRKDMAALLEHLCKIETAILDNDNAKAEELFKALKKIEDDGHEKFSDQ